MFIGTSESAVRQEPPNSLGGGGSNLICSSQLKWCWCNLKIHYNLLNLPRNKREKEKKNRKKNRKDKRNCFDFIIDSDPAPPLHPHPRVSLVTAFLFFSSDFSIFRWAWFKDKHVTKSLVFFLTLSWIYIEMCSDHSI